MKSPWKIFTELTSRRRSQTTELPPVEMPPQEAVQKETLRVQLIIGNSRPIVALDENPQVDLMATTAIPVADADRTPTFDIPANVDEHPVSAPSGVRSPHDETMPSADQASNSAEVADLARSRSGNAAGKNGNIPVQKAVLALKDGPHTTSTPEADPVSNAVLLDAEIKQLRRQLAERIRLQNGQLREMIARFDR